MRTKLNGCAAAVVWMAAAAAQAQSARLVAMQGNGVAPDLAVHGNVGSPAINARGKVAFMSQMARNSIQTGITGLVTDAGGGLACVARDSLPAFPGPLAFSAFDVTNPFCFGDDSVLMVAHPMVSGSSTIDSVWAGAVNGFARIAATGVDAPLDAPGTYDNGLPTGRVAASYSRNGRMAFSFGFRDTGSGVRYNAIFSDGAGDLGAHAQAADPGEDGFVSFGTLLMNDAGTVCARAVFQEAGLQNGVFIGQFGDLEGAATTEDIAPDEDSNWLPGSPLFTAFHSISINNEGMQWVVFDADLSNGQSGIFLLDDEYPLRLVTLTGRPVPGVDGATFTVFGSPLVCTNGDVLFMGQFVGPGVDSTNNVGLYRYRDFVVEVLGRSGDSVRGAEGSIYFTVNTPIAANGLGQAAFVGTQMPSGEQVLLATDTSALLVGVYRAETPVTLAPGMVRTLSSLSGVIQSSDGDGRASSINGAGEVALAATAAIPPGQPLGAEGRCVVVFQIPAAQYCGSADFDGDGDSATDADIEAFFACIAGNCCDACGSADFDGDGDTATDADIEAFFRVLAGGYC